MWAHPSKAGRALFHGKQACSWNAASSAGSSKESAPYRSLSLAQRQIQVERVKCNTTVVYKSPQSSKAGAVTIKWKVRGDSGTCIHFAKPPTRLRPVERTLRFTLVLTWLLDCFWRTTDFRTHTHSFANALHGMLGKTRLHSHRYFSVSLPWKRQSQCGIPIRHHRFSESSPLGGDLSSCVPERIPFHNGRKTQFASVELRHPPHTRHLNKRG